MPSTRLAVWSRIKSSSWIWPLLSVLPSLIVMRGMFSSTRVFYFRDSIGIFLPIHTWFRETVATGEFPLWDPYPAFGQTAVGDGLRQLFFPPILLLRLLPFDTLGLNLTLGLPFPLAALGMFVFLRERLGNPASALGAVLFSISSPVLSTGSMPNLSWSIAFAPWVLWSLGRLTAEPRGWRFALASVFVSLQVLAGEPLTAGTTMGIAVFFAVADDVEGWRAWMRRNLLTVSSILAGFLLCAGQLLPMAATVAQSRRSLSLTDASLYWDTHPYRLLELVAVFPYGDSTSLTPEFSFWFPILCSGREPFLASLYTGIGTLVLGMIGAVTVRNRRTAIWLLVMFGGLICALGRYTPVYLFLNEHISLLRSFRMPEKYILLAVFALVVLAAQGFESLLNLTEKTRALIAAFVCAMLVVNCYLGAIFLAPWMAESLGLPDEAARILKVEMLWASPAIIALTLALPAIIAIHVKTEGRNIRLAGALALLVVFDPALAGSGLNPQIERSYFERPEWAAEMASSGGRSIIGYNVARFISVSHPDLDNLVLQTNVAGIPATAGEAIYITRVGLYPSYGRVRDSLSYDTSTVWPVEYSYLVYRFVVATKPERSLFLQRAGVRTQITQLDPMAPYDRSALVRGISPVKAYVSDVPASRIALVPGYQVEPDFNAAMKYLFREDFDVTATVVVDRAVDPAGTAGTADTAGVRFLEDRSNTVTIDVQTPQEATLLLWDSFGSGWHAEVDGQPAEIQRAFGFFRAVRVVPGSHVVRMWYWPRSLTLGLWISGLAAILLAFVAFRFRGNRRRE